MRWKKHVDGKLKITKEISIHHVDHRTDMIEADQTSNPISYNTTAMTKVQLETLLEGDYTDGTLHREVVQGRS